MRLSTYIKSHFDDILTFDMVYIHMGVQRTTNNDSTLEDLDRIYKKLTSENKLYIVPACACDLKLPKTLLKSNFNIKSFFSVSKLPFHKGEKIYNIICQPIQKD